MPGPGWGASWGRTTSATADRLGRCSSAVFLGPVFAPISHCYLQERMASESLMIQQPQSEMSILLAAIEIGAATERAEFLEQACAGNPSLRSEIEALLQAHESPQRLLDAPVAGVPTIDEPQLLERPGAVIGPYKLLEQIGE